MRLAVATTSYPRFPGDYAGAFVRDLNAGLRGHGVEPVTFAPAADGVRDVADDEGGPVVRVSPRDPRARALFYGDGMEANVARDGLWATQEGLRDYGAALRAAIAAAGPFDAVVAHWLVPTALLLAGRVGAPLFGVCHGGDAHVLSRPCVGRGFGAALRGRLAGVLTVSRAAAAIVRRRVGLEETKLVVAPMGVDAAFFAPRENDPPREPDLVLAVGRLIPVKGFDVLVRAVAALRGSPSTRASAAAPSTRSTAVRLRILGEGPERPQLESLARDLGVRLELPGTVDRAAVAADLRRAAVVAVPSRRLPNGREEGTPVVALEALCAGAATVGTRTGGLVDLLAPAALCAPDDPAALAALLALALRDPAALRAADAAPACDRSKTAAALLRLMR